MTTVLVTGGSGFIAGHCVLQLLDHGYDVRATVRSLDRTPDLAGVDFVAADLLSDDGWAEAVRGCDFVLHVASPVQPGQVENEDDLIVPAREGTLRVVRAARDAGVQRVVLTSAFHAVGWGHPHDDHVFTEDDWTVLDGPGTDAYGRSKTLAERAAWDFVATEGGTTQLTTILPVAVMGPLLGDGKVSGANHIVERMLRGTMTGFPNLYIPIVDVRDVAAAHVEALKTEEAAGHRFLLSSGPALRMEQIGAVLREHLGDAAGLVPTTTVPDEQLRDLVPDLGYERKVSSEKARRVLGWTSRDAEQAIVAAGESMV